MKWSGQVLHVALKDARMLKWYLVAYVLLVTLGTFNAAELAGMEPNQLWAVLATLMGAVVVTLLVQSDSAFRADAFWATKPLARSAVLGGKLALTAIGVVGIAAIGQAIVLPHYGFTGQSVITSAATGAFWYASILSSALLLGVLTSDLRSSLLVMVGYVVLSQIGAALGYYLFDIPPLDSGRSQAGELVLLLFTVAIALYLYQTRRRTRATQLALLTFVPGIIPILGHSVRESSAEAPEQIRVAVLHLWSPDMRGWLAPETYISFQLTDAKPEYAYTLVDSYAEVTASDGRVSRAPIEANRIYLNRPAPPILHGSTWATRSAFGSGYQEQVKVRLTDAQREALARRAATLTVNGWMEVLEGRVVGSIPLKSGASFGQDGRRITIEGARMLPFPDATRMHNSGPLVSVTEAILDPNGRVASFSDLHQLLRFGIYEPDRTVTSALETVSGGGGWSLWALGATRAIHTFQLGIRSDPSFRWDEDHSLDQAQLVIFDWKSIGAYPVSVEMSREKPDYR